WQWDIHLAQNKIGDVVISQGDLPAALASYRAGLAIAERLTATDPGNAEWQSSLMFSHVKVGEGLLVQGDRPNALISFGAGQAIGERLAQTDPGNTRWQRDLRAVDSR